MAFLLIVYGVAMFFVGAMFFGWMVEKYAPDLYSELRRRVLSKKEA